MAETTGCKHGHLEPCTQCSEEKRAAYLETRLAEVGEQAERWKASRIEYQTIVYGVCNALDDPGDVRKGKGVVTSEVVERVKALCEWDKERKGVIDEALCSEIEQLRAELEERRKWDPHWCDRCALYYGNDICPECELEDLRARLADVELERDTARQMMDAAGKHLAAAAGECYTFREALQLPDVQKALRKVFLEYPQPSQRILAREVLDATTEEYSDGSTESERTLDAPEEQT